MSAVSRKVMPRSSARWMVATDSSQSVWPYHSLMPMQPRPCAETESSPSETLRMSVTCPLLGRIHAAAVDPDFDVEQIQALLLLQQRRPDPLAVLLQQFEAFLLACPRPDEAGVALHLTHRHAGRA